MDFGLLCFSVAQIVLNRSCVVRAGLHTAPVFDQDRLDWNLCGHILQDSRWDTHQLLRHETHKMQAAKLQAKPRRL